MISYTVEKGFYGNALYIKYKDGSRYHFFPHELFRFTGDPKNFDIKPGNSFEHPIETNMALGLIEDNQLVLGWDKITRSNNRCCLMSKTRALLRQKPKILSSLHKIKIPKIPGLQDYVIRLSNNKYLVRSGVGVIPSNQPEDLEADSFGWELNDLHSSLLSVEKEDFKKCYYLRKQNNYV